MHIAGEHCTTQGATRRNLPPLTTSMTAVFVHSWQRNDSNNKWVLHKFAFCIYFFNRLRLQTASVVVADYKTVHIERGLKSSRKLKNSFSSSVFLANLFLEVGLEIIGEKAAHVRNRHSEYFRCRVVRVLLTNVLNNLLRLAGANFGHDHHLGVQFNGASNLAIVGLHQGHHIGKVG